MRQIVSGYAEIGRHETALSLLDSVAGQFAGTGAAEGIAALRKQVEDSKGAYAAAAERGEQERHRQAVQSWREEVQRRLADAKARGDSESAGRLERLLGNG